MAITPKNPVDIPNTTGSITPITTPTTSLANARIGYKNLLTSTTTPEAAVMLIPNTWERYRPSSGLKTVKFQMSSASIDFVGIAAHNAGTQDGGIDITVGYASTIGGSVTTLTTMSFNDDNGALMVLFDAVTAQEVVLTIPVQNFTGGLELGVIYAGKALEMPHGLWGGHTPIVLSGETKYQNTMSDSGNFLGRSIVRQGIETSYKWRHLNNDWVRSDFMPFVKSARTTPFFLLERPDTYTETAFGFTTNDIKPVNMSGGARLMETGFNMRGHEDVQ